MRWLLLLVLTGCLIVPQTRETTRSLGQYTGTPILGPFGDVTFQVTESYGTVHVVATRQRRCYREVRERYESRKELTAGVAGPDNAADARAMVLVGVMLAPIAVLSGVVTAVAVAADDPEVDLSEQTVRVIASDCPIAARRALVELALPSGQKIRTRTNDQGLVSIVVPDSEPDQGTVIVRSADSEATIAYSRGLAVAAAPAAVDSVPRVSRRP